MRKVSLEYREHDDGSDAFLIFRDEYGNEAFLEWDFVVDALQFRESDFDGFETIWTLMAKFEERGAPMQGLDS